MGETIMKILVRRRWWLGLILVLILGLSYWYDRSTSGEVATSAEVAGQAAGQTATKAHRPGRTVTEAGAFKLETASAGTCTLLKPSDWTAPVPAEGSRAVDLTSRDGSMYAGYGIQAVNSQLAAYARVYQAPLNDPDLYSTDPATVAKAYAKIVVGGLGGDPNLVYTSKVNQAIGEYQLRSLASRTHQGVLFHHRTGFPGDGFNYSYALPMYFALTRSDRWPTHGLMVARVAASIRCTATLVSRGGSGPDPGGSSPGGGDKNGPTEPGYDPQLGTEYVHDPTTGENYLVDPSQHWSETGPNGPGYYIPKSGGNDYTQLQPGRVD